MLLTCDLPCVKNFLPAGEERINRGHFYKTPHYVGFKILICGKKDSHFPFQLFVGPDWPCMLMTYALIIVPTTLFTLYIADKISIALTLVSMISGITLVLVFSYAACSDPGVVFRDPGSEDAVLEEGGHGSSSHVGMMECNHCAIMRPTTAMHCYECGVCVDHLDHHCPWTGKCIGAKTLMAFYWFLFTLFVHITYVAGVSLYYISYYEP